MATIHVRSTDGSNADNGSTWALAKQTLGGADGIDAAGDLIAVSQVHAETLGGTITWNFAGTIAAPTRIICGNDGASPPTAVATTATVTKTSAGSFTMNGCVYAYGITFQFTTASGAGDAMVFAASANNRAKFENCNFILHTGSGQFIANAYGVAGATMEWKNCGVKFGHTGQQIYLPSAFHWNGGSVLSGSTSVTRLIGLDGSSAAASGGVCVVENVDLSNLGTTVNLVSIAGAAAWRVTLRNIKLPASWAGNLLHGSIGAPGRIEMYNADSGSTNYKLWIEDYYGQIKDEATLVRSGGASDGVTPIAWKMVSNANPVYPLSALASGEMAIYNSATGSAKTVTVEILRDSASNLKENEVWLEVRYLSDSGSPLGALVTDCVADALTSANDQTASSVTWTTTGMANPNKQKLSVTFTPQKAGYFVAKVMLAKASTTIYVDPKLTVT